MQITITIPESTIALLLESDVKKTEGTINELAEEVAEEYKSFISEAVFNEMRNRVTDLITHTA